jgi:hypothetical protein
MPPIIARRRTQVILPLAAGLAILGGYGVHALRSRVEPILNLRFLRYRGYATSSAMMFLSGVTLFGALFLLPLYYQQGRSASALQAGLLLAPQGVGVAIGALATSRSAGRSEPRSWPSSSSRRCMPPRGPTDLPRIRRDVCLGPRADRPLLRARTLAARPHAAGPADATRIEIVEAPSGCASAAGRPAS